MGKRDGVVALADAVGPRTIAVGALAGLEGEITVIDGETSLSRGSPPRSERTRAPEPRAALLVAADVREWKRVALEGPIAAADFDATIERIAREHGVEALFPFRIEGEVDVRWHVVAGGADPHASAFQGHTAGAASLAGFFSRAHQGVFTHRGRATHVHVIAGEHTGHADEVAVRAGATLLLPR